MPRRLCFLFLLALLAWPRGASAQLPPGPDPVVDVLVLYSDRALQDLLDDGRQVLSSVEAAIAQTNRVLADSGARARMRLVGVERSVNLAPNLPRDTISMLAAGLVSEAITLRETRQADLVYAITPRGGDIARDCEAVTPLAGYDLRLATRGHYAAGQGLCRFTYTMMRALGLGTFPGTGDAARPYGYGVLRASTEASIGTIGASEVCSVDCTPVERLTSPGASVDGVPIGDAATADAVRAVDEGALFVSSYRGCAYDVTPAGASVQVPAMGGTYAYTITTDAACATGLPDTAGTFVTVDHGDPLRRGSAVVTIAVGANPTYAPRVTEVTIGHTRVTFRQAATNDGECLSADVRPATLSLSATATTFAFEYRAPEGCRLVQAWNAGSSSQVRVRTELIGQGAAWVPAELPIGRNTRRTTTVTNYTLSGAALDVTQAAGLCTPSLPAFDMTVQVDGTTVSAGLSLPDGCDWSLDPLPSWVTATPSAATAPSSIEWRVAANPGVTRVAQVGLRTSDGVTTWRIIQAGATCTALAYAGAGLPPAGGTSVLTLAFKPGQGACPWQVTGLPSWLTASPQSGVGPATISLTAAANEGASRLATLLVGGALVGLEQTRANCVVTLDPGDVVPAEGGLRRVDVSARSDCSWGGQPMESWAQPLPVVPRGEGDGWFLVRVDPNPGYDREQLIAGAGLTPPPLRQAGALGPWPGGTDCVAAAVPSHTLTAEGQALTITLHVRGHCGWTLKPSVPWLVPLTTSSVGPATIVVVVTPNASGVPRTGDLQVNGQRISVTQAPLFTCRYQPLSGLAPPSGGRFILSVFAVRGCGWTTPADTGTPWLTFDAPGQARAGSGAVDVTALPNTTGAERVASLDLFGQSITVTQYPDPRCRLSFAPASIVVPSAATSFDVLFTLGEGCPWTARVDQAWLTASGPTAGVGPGRVRVSSAASSSELNRFGQIRINGAAFSVSQEPFVPATPSRQFLAEGATGRFFETDIALLNPYLAPVPAVLTFLRSGQPPLIHTVDIPASSRITVRPADLPGLGTAEFSTVIDTQRPIAIDRTMRWAEGRGSHSETGIVVPGLTWYLAEGATMGGFNLFYLLQNPGDTDADVVISYLRGGGRAPLQKSYVIPARSRQNVWVDIEQFDTPVGPQPLLAEAEVSGVIESRNGVPIIVERAMYLDRPGQPFAAGHNSAGITAPALEWYLAEGATGAFFDLFVLIANPTDTASHVRVEYLRAQGGPITKTYDVPARSRFNIWVDEEVFDGLGKALADAAVSMTLKADNGVPIVVERAMWWPGADWHEAHNSRGATAPGRRWGIADGRRDAGSGTETFVLVANTSDHPARVVGTYLLGGGAAAYTSMELAPKSRGNLPFPVLNSAVGAIEYGVIVESMDIGDGRVADLVVERATYSDAAGVRWAAGSNSLATRLPDQ